LGTIKAEYREVITMTKLEGLSYQVIGEKLHKSPDAVRMLAVRGMAALTTAFGKAS
jgi:DNA-directed RNA polymerase specialized sigma24 family protein